jgi:hypothetical protein
MSGIPLAVPMVTTPLGTTGNLTPLARQRDTRLGNIFGEANLLAPVVFPTGMFTAAQKTAFLAEFDNYFHSIFPFEWEIANPTDNGGFIRIVHRTRKYGIPTDTRPGARQIVAGSLEARISEYKEPGRHERYGGFSAPAVDFDKIDQMSLEKIMNLWWNFRKAIANS